MKFTKYIGCLIFIIALSITSCEEKPVLIPEPLSYISKMKFCRDQLRNEYYGDNTALLMEYNFTDIGVNGMPDANVHNLPLRLTPVTTDGNFKTRNYWTWAWDAIKNANSAMDRIELMNWSNNAEREALMGEGLFHRAYWYYRLVHQFGDVPLMLREKETDDAEMQYYTYTRESILKKIAQDMEVAVQGLSINVYPGGVNRAAGYHLLTKIYLSLREFDKAIEAASWVINSSGHQLMTNRFGVYADDPGYDVMWDLHQKENKSLPQNKEGILVAQEKFGTSSQIAGGTQRMRDAVPAWWWTPVLDPDKKRGAIDRAGDPLLDSLGRGIGRARTTNYYNYDLWKDPNDLRHSDVNWWGMDEYYYNVPTSNYYGQPFVREFLGKDTIRTWYPFAYNKIFVRDEEREGAADVRGGHSDWYIFRLAETYLLRAEAYYWKDDLNNAATDINAVRSRAKAAPVASGDVTIDYIFAERARELYFETPRKTELTRVAYIMAQLGRDGYSLDNMTTNNWYYDTVIKFNEYYRDKITYGDRYEIAPYNIYWPIPQTVINANTQGQTNQAPGYAGSDQNIQPREL